MYTLNTSFMIMPEIHDRWYQMLTEKYIPLLKSEGYNKILFTRVLSAESVEHYTYSLQVEIEDLGDYKHISEELLSQYIEIASPLFGDKAVHFITILKHITIE